MCYIINKYVLHEAYLKIFPLLILDLKKILLEKI